MDIMAHPTPRWTPLARTPGSASLARTPGSARTPGGSDLEPAPDPGWKPLGEATDFTVGVVDTGVLLTWPGRTTHPWLAGHVAICPEDDEDRLTVPGDGLLPTLAPGDGHGTFVTGLVLREAPRARVRMHAAIDTSAVGPDGLGDAEDRMVAAAIRSLALDPRVQVINLSFGGGVFGDRNGPPALIAAALAEVDTDRVAVVAAAGNDPSGVRSWPAAFDGVIAVGAWAMDALGEYQLADFSNRGSWVEAYAAGVAVVGPFLDQGTLGVPLTAEDADGNGVDDWFRGWAAWSGTSFAAAVFSGRVAAHALAHGVTGAHAARRLLELAPQMPGEQGRLIT
jgi:subtilisin family serine protease